MSVHWLWLTVLWPLLAGMILFYRNVPDFWINLFLRTAALPALIAVFCVPVLSEIDLPFVLLGMQFQLNELNQIFLLFTSTLWLFAGWFSVSYSAHDEERQRFCLFFFLSLAGNLGLIVAADMVSFYLFFAVMTFSAAGLVLHYRTEEALRATKIYLFMSIMGEVMVLAALLLIAAHANTLNIREAVVMIPGSPYESVIIGLVIFGFGVKAGLFMMHLWLPLAHSVAPVPASAILSGSMLKAGLLGWIMFLPGSVSVYPFWGSLMIFLGIVGALYCAVMGMMQQNPKTNLAYSSASQMGLMTLCIGLGLSCGVEWVDAVWIVSVYAMNHALAKGALFMGVGVVLSEQVRLRTQRIYPVMIGLILLSLSISGLPYTGGGLAKRSLKHLAHHVQNGWSSALDGLLLLSTVMTALLLSRLVYLLYLHCKDHCEQVEEKSTLLLVWLVNVAVATLFVWLGIYHFGLPVSTEIFSGMDWLKSGVPIAVAVSLFLFVCLKGRKVMPLVPTGDVVCFFEKIAVYIKFIWVEFFSKPFDNANNSLDGWVNRWVPEDGKKDKIVKIEQVARNFQISGFVLMAIIILFVISFLL